MKSKIVFYNFIIFCLVLLSLNSFSKTVSINISNKNIDSLQIYLNTIIDDTVNFNFEKSNYEFSKPLILNCDNKVLNIYGNNSTINGTMPESFYLNRVTGILDITTHNDLTIKNLSIQFNAIEYGILSGINIISNFKKVDLDSINSRGAPFCGIYLQNVDSGLVEFCNCFYNKMGGLCIYSSKNLIVENCEFSYNGCQTPVWGYGLAFVNCLPISEKIIVRQNTAKNNQRKGFDVHAGKNILIEYNTVIGFEYAGIYAVSDGGINRRVSNITIRNNFINGDTAHFKIRGIDVGSYGKNPDSCGYFIIENNHVINTHNIENSSAISVCNPDSGVAIENVIIRGNTIENGSADKKTSAIECLQNDVFIKSIIIEKNRVHSEFSKFPILISGAENAEIKNNDILCTDKIRSKKGIKLKNVKQVTLSDNIVKLK